MAKSYFADEGITYAEADVTTDRAALREMVVTTGQSSVPVIVVGSKAMIGWSQAQFEELLAG